MKIIRIAAAFAGIAVFAISIFAQNLEVELQRAQQKELANGDHKAAIAECKRIADRAGKDHAVAAKSLLHEAEALQSLGDAQAQKIYQQIVNKYGDQKEAVATAQARLKDTATPAVVYRVVWTLPASSPIQIGRVSPDGRYVAYTPNTDLMIRDLANGSTRTVAHCMGQPGPTLAWTRDGRHLAFELETDDGTEIRFINFDGSGPRTLMQRRPQWARVLDFFQDGARLLCSRYQEGSSPNGDSLVFWINITDTSIHELVLRPGPGGSGWPRLSPDGRYVALRHSPGLSLLPTDEGPETIISRNSDDLNAAAWSPNSHYQLLFVRRRGDTNDLWTVPISDGKLNGQPDLVYRDFGSISIIDHQVTKDGSLYYVKPGSNGNEDEFYSASVDFGAGKRLTDPIPEFGGSNGLIRWSPDGKYLAYTKLNAPRDLLVRSLETAQTRDVKPKLQTIYGGFDWSPDGKRFAMAGRDLTVRKGFSRLALKPGTLKPSC